MVTSKQAADVIYLTPKDFNWLSRSGKIFDKPVVPKSVSPALALILTLTPTLIPVRSQNLHGCFVWLTQSKHCSFVSRDPQALSVCQFRSLSGSLDWLLQSKPGLSTRGLNELDFRNITQSMKPSSTHLPQCRLLEWLCCASPKEAPGKRSLLTLKTLAEHTSILYVTKGGHANEKGA